MLDIDLPLIIDLNIENREMKGERLQALAVSKDIKIMKIYLLRPRKDFREILSCINFRLSKIRDSRKLSNEKLAIRGHRLSFIAYRFIKSIREAKRHCSDFRPASFLSLLLT